jgi:predicted HTH transcriptional regulator
MDAVRFAAEIATLVRETHGVEFKSSSSAEDKASIARVARAAMAMSHRPNGGFVVVGVSEDAAGLHFDGVAANALQTWVPDTVADRLFAYADPPIAFSLSVAAYDGKPFVVFDVEEFAEIPIICKKDYPGILQAGAVYVRPRRKPESVPIPTAADMRDLLDLATEKMSRRLLATAERVGLVPEQTTSTDVDAYINEIEDLL